MPQKMGGAGQRSHITIMFTDLCDSTLIASKVEPEEYSELLEELGTGFVEIAKQHGGDCIRIDGDGFIFTFGYPKLHEDTPRRAVEAALEIHALLEEVEERYNWQDVRLQLHTGIHSGIVLVKPGDIARGKYEILGDPTNITARLCEFAGPGEIVISDETLGRSSEHFQISQQSLLGLRGRGKKLLVKKVVGENRSGSKENIWATHSVKFTGRNRELEWLERFINSEDENTVLAHLQAEAGMGKSRLLHEFSNQMASTGSSVHLGICEAYLGVKPFQPIEQILRSILSSEFGYFGKSLKKYTSDMPGPISTIINFLNREHSQKDENNLTSKQLTDTFIKLFKLIKQENKILIIDDWQWVDDASKSVIEGLVKSELKNLKIILASRTQDSVFLEMNGAERLQLHPFSAEDIKDTIRRLVPNVEPFAMKRIEEYSGGNPLYLEELCHAIRDSRFDFETKKAGSWLNSLIYTRFD